MLSKMGARLGCFASVYIWEQQLESQYLSWARCHPIFAVSSTQFTSVYFIKAAAAGIDIFFINVYMFTRLICFTSRFRQARHRSLWVFSFDKWGYNKHIKLGWRIDITSPYIILFFLRQSQRGIVRVLFHTHKSVSTATGKENASEEERNKRDQKDRSRVWH